MKKRVGTVCFIIDGSKVLLALIEYSNNNLKWNGIGGFVKEGELPEDAVIRETSEETYIQINKKNLVKIKEIELDIKLIVYKTDKWGGELKIKDESLKELKWFDKNEIPYDQMFEDNKNWLPAIFN